MAVKEKFKSKDKIFPTSESVGDSLVYGQKYTLELDFTDKRIHLYQKGISASFQMEIPLSFRLFIREVSNGIFVDIGNTLTVFPVKKTVGFYTDIAEINKNYREQNKEFNHFLIFGQSGVDSELYAFYLNRRLNNGEYPVVLIQPYISDNKYYTLLNSQFDKFLNIKYELLKLADKEETMTYEEANRLSNDSDLMDKSEQEHQRSILEAYQRYDPSMISKGMIDLETRYDLEWLQKIIAGI